jgi:hypothetical protein
MEIISSANVGVLLLEKEDGKIAVQCAIGLDEEAFSQCIRSINDSIVSRESQIFPDKPPAGMQEAIKCVIESPALGPKVKSYTNAKVVRLNRWVGNLILISFRDIVFRRDNCCFRLSRTMYLLPRKS